MLRKWFYRSLLSTQIHFSFQSYYTNSNISCIREWTGCLANANQLISTNQYKWMENCIWKVICIIILYAHNIHWADIHYSHMYVVRTLQMQIDIEHVFRSQIWSTWEQFIKRTQLVERYYQRIRKSLASISEGSFVRIWIIRLWNQWKGNFFHFCVVSTSGR